MIRIFFSASLYGCNGTTFLWIIAHDGEKSVRVAKFAFCDGQEAFIAVALSFRVSSPRCWKTASCLNPTRTSWIPRTSSFRFKTEHMFLFVCFYPLIYRGKTNKRKCTDKNNKTSLDYGYNRLSLQTWNSQTNGAEAAEVPVSAMRLSASQVGADHKPGRSKLPVSSDLTPTQPGAGHSLNVSRFWHFLPQNFCRFRMNS